MAPLRKALSTAAGVLTLTVAALTLPAAAAVPPAPRVIDHSCPAGQYGTMPFTDVPAGDPHADAITCVRWWAIMEAVSGTSFVPDGVVTRGDMATFLARVITHSGGGLPAQPPDRFPDDDQDVHAHNIDQLAAVGIVSGRADGTYGPDAPVRRGEMAAFLVRTYRYRTGAALSPAGDFFTDDSDSVFSDAINSAATARFVGGFADGTYRPHVAITREQMATFVGRALDALVENGFSTTPPPVRTPAPPAPKVTWTAPTATTLQAGSTGPYVLAAQQRLSALGYWLGTADGTYADTTVQAVYALQKAAGLTRDGVIGPNTWHALELGVVPTPKSAVGHVVEIDLALQLIEIVDAGKLTAVLNTSTGSGQHYWSGGVEKVATTPTGQFTVYRQVDKWDPSPLGELYRPKYFTTTGVAVHGYPSVPPYPASHGCTRVSIAAMDWLWSSGEMPIGTTVWVR